MGTFLLSLIILFSLLSRFYGLSWGNEFFFHPDERNIGSAVSLLQFPNLLNPHFFAYGSFPMYLIYFTGIILNFLLSIFNSQSLPLHVSFEHAILIARFYSALFSALTVILIYFVTRKLKGKQTALFAAFLSGTSIGFIQFAHFGTFEMWLTFLVTLLFYFCLKVIEQGRMLNIVLVSITLGLLIATKISSLALLPLPTLAIVLYYFSKVPNRKYTCIPVIFFSTLVIILIFIITSPFVLLDWPSFLSSMQHEGSVALGALPVFYTGEFFGTIPVIFQFSDVYPFLLNPFIAVLFVPSLAYVTYIGIKKRMPSYYLLFTIYYLLFLSQAFFFAKWVRYMVPTLPFIYVIASIALSDFFLFLRNTKAQMKRYYYTSILVLSFLFTLSYLASTYMNEDTRIEASLWAKNNIPEDAKIVSEVYDLGITPFNQYFPHIKLFNFYDLDNDSPVSTPQTLSSLLSQTDYIVLPSQRILKVRLANKEKFPNGHRFYSALVGGELGFEKIYETQCNAFCEVTYLGDPVGSFEQTATVFDRPTVFIFKNSNNLKLNEN